MKVIKAYLHFSTFLCISQHLSTFLCIPLHFSSFLCIPLNFSEFLCIPLHLSTFHCISLHSFAFLYISLHFSAFYILRQFDGAYRRPMEAIFYIRWGCSRRCPCCWGWCPWRSTRPGRRAIPTCHAGAGIVEETWSWKLKVKLPQYPHEHDLPAVLAMPPPAPPHQLLLRLVGLEGSIALLQYDGIVAWKFEIITFIQCHYTCAWDFSGMPLSPLWTSPLKNLHLELQSQGGHPTEIHHTLQRSSSFSNE